MVCRCGAWKMKWDMITLNEKQTKELIKQSILELFEERKDLLYNLFAEIIEDVILVQAISEGAQTDTVSRDEIFDVLGGDVWRLNSKEVLSETWER